MFIKSLGVAAQMEQAWIDLVPVIMFKTFPSISVKNNLNDTSTDFPSPIDNLRVFKALISFFNSRCSFKTTSFVSFMNSSLMGRQNLTDCGVRLFQIGLPDESSNLKGMTVVANREVSLLFDEPVSLNVCLN